MPSRVQQSPKLDADTLSKLVNVFMRESDRACAILGGELLNAELEALLNAAAVEPIDSRLLRGYGPLANFSSRIDLAFYFGLLSGEDRNDLHTVRDIRNLFAHRLDHNLSFDSVEVAEHIRKLQLPGVVADHMGLIKGTIDTSRMRFQIGVGLLSFVLRRVRMPNVGKSQVQAPFRIA